METLGSLLPPHFERIHKSYLANLKAMKSIALEGDGKYALELIGGKRIPLSRGKYKERKERA